MLNLIVKTLEEGGLAQLNGLLEGDIIIEVNGNPVNRNIDFARELSRAQGRISLLINRDGEDIHILMPSGKLGLITEEAMVNLDALRAKFEISALTSKVSVVTMDCIEGKTLKKVLGIVSAEYAVGMNIVKDVLVGGRDLFGGRSKTVQDAFREARNACLLEIRREAESLGANAVIGLRFQHSQMSGTGTTMLLLIASGTAVQLTDRSS